MQKRVQPLQARLRVSSADDPFEREADRLARRVITSLSSSSPFSREDEHTLSAQRLSRLSAVHPASEFDAPAGFEQGLRASLGSGRPLPAPARAHMEGRFGLQFDDVRIHTDAAADRLSRSIHAQAFTHRNHIFFSAGQFNPNTQAGRYLLAHELAHTVHQTGTAQHAVQRLISLKDFKKRTSSGLLGFLGWRGKFKPLDRLLDEYHKLSWQEKDIPTRNTKLDQIEQVARAYTGKRQIEVDEFIASVTTERRFIRPLAEAIPDINGKRNLKEAIQKVFQAHDAFLEAVRAGHPIPDDGPFFLGFFEKAQRALNELGTRDQVMRELIADDLSRVEHIAADTNTHPLLRNILNEVLANKDQIYFQETPGMASGAVLAGQKERDRGITAKYRLDMQMAQAEGSPERLSSLVHEMTHIAVQEKFGNTAIHLAFKRAESDANVLALSRRRTEQCRALKRLLEETREQWLPGQYRVLAEKTEYPINASGKNTLSSYAETFKKKGELTQTDYDRIINLAKQGANNTLIEFDTVINQMMFLMTAWRVPNDNKFYVKLREVAQEAYDWRHA